MRQDFKSIATSRTIILKAAFTFLLFGLPLSNWAQYRMEGQNRPSFPTRSHDPGVAAQGHYPGSQYASTSFALSEPNFTALFDQVRRESEQPGNYQSANYQELLRRQCMRAVQEEDTRFLENSCGWARPEEQDAAPHAAPGRSRPV